MTAELGPNTWLQNLDREYLNEFIKDGGAAVKFVVPFDQAAADTVGNGIDDRASAHHFLTAHVDSGETRLHMMDQLFFRVAEQIRWKDLAQAVLEKLARQDGYVIPDTIDGGYARALALVNDLDEDFMRGEMRRHVSSAVFRRRTLAKDFRIAMSQLCLAQLASGADQETTEEAILQWLTGETRSIGAVKPYQIYTRINRTNARFLFESMLDWIRFAGCSGLVIQLDIARFTLTQNPKDGLNFYTNASRLDGYELLRQFVDATDRMLGLLLVVIAEREFLDDDPHGTGIGQYQALFFRVFDEIRDRQMVNPMATLVRLSSTSTQAVPA